MKTSILVLALALASTGRAAPQGGAAIGAQLAIGYTVIDVPTAVGVDSSEIKGSDQTFSALKVQGTFARLGHVRLGSEVGYNRLYSYDSRSLDGSIGQHDVLAWDVSALVVIDAAEQLELQAGAGAYFVGGKAFLGIRAASLYRIPVGPGTVLPFGLCVDVIFGDGTPVGLGLTAGLEYRL